MSGTGVPGVHVSWIYEGFGYLKFIDRLEELRVNMNFSNLEIPVGILYRQVNKWNKKEVSSMKVLRRDL